MQSTNSLKGKPLPTFLHTSQDGRSNQPIRAAEIEKMEGSCHITTGGKANRAQRRKFAKNKNKFAK